MKRLAGIIGMVAFALTLAACPAKSPPPSPPAPRAPTLSGLPVEITVRQRSTTIVPGSDGALRLTIDDITRGQVMVTLLDKEGMAFHGPISMREDDGSDFVLDGDHYGLTLADLSNALVGEDFARFIIDSGAGETAVVALTERQKIEQLLEQIGALENAIFIRNGTEHSASDAAEHLRTKWEAAGDRIATARDFIDQIATESSMSGERYEIRFSDGTTVATGAYLHERLKAIEAGR